MRPIRSLAAAGLLVALSLYAEPSHATDPFKTVETSAPQEVVGGMSLKMVRGISNVTLGWWELPKQVYQTFREDGVAMGLSVGPLKGIGMTLVRTLSGVGEVLTFPFPFPGFYDPYFEPEFVWQKERKVFDSSGAPHSSKEGSLTAPASAAGSAQSRP